VHKDSVVVVDGALVGGEDSAGGKLVRKGTQVVTGVRWVALGPKPLLVVTTEQNVQIWDSETSRLVFLHEPGSDPEKPRSALQSPVSASSRSEGLAAEVAASASAVMSRVAAFRGIGASHVARTVLVGNSEGQVLVFTGAGSSPAGAESFSHSATLSAHPGAAVCDLSVDESGIKMISGASDGDVTLWDARSTSKLYTFSDPSR
jgi:WD40 repeat protein